jgi:hypothetical protein
VRAGPPNTLAGRLGQPLPCDECVRKALWSGRTGGPVAWQPPHRQDEDLVPLTAGACSPCRRSSRPIPGQTSRPDPNPDASGAAPRRHRATPAWPDATAGRPTLGSLGEAALSCLGIGSELTWPPSGTPPSVVRAVDLSIEPWSDWHRCHGRTAKPCPTGWWATGRRKAVDCLIARVGPAHAGWSLDDRPIARYSTRKL